MSTPYRLLAVDDDPNMTTSLKRALSKLYADSLNVLVAHSAGEALEVIGRERIDILLTDIGMPDRSGDELVSDVVALQKGIQIIVISGGGSILPAISCFQKGALTYIRKPFEMEDLRKGVNIAVERLDDWHCLIREMSGANYY